MHVRHVFAVDEFSRGRARSEIGSAAQAEPQDVADGKLRTELVKISGVQRFLVSLVERVSCGMTPQGSWRRNKFGSRRSCRSDDPHVPRLAIVTGARRLRRFDGD